MGKLFAWLKARWPSWPNRAFGVSLTVMATVLVVVDFRTLNDPIDKVDGFWGSVLGVPLITTLLRVVAIFAVVFLGGSIVAWLAQGNWVRKAMSTEVPDPERSMRLMAGVDDATSKRLTKLEEAVRKVVEALGMVLDE